MEGWGADKKLKRSKKLTWTNIYSNSRFMLSLYQVSSSCCELSWLSGCLQGHTPQVQTLADQALSSRARWWMRPSHCVVQTQDVPPRFLALWQMTGHPRCPSNIRSFLSRSHELWGRRESFPQTLTWLQITAVWQTSSKPQFSSYMLD